MKLQTTILAATAALLPVLGFAAAPSYTWLEANYVTTDQSGDGYSFNGSLALTKNIHVFGGYVITRDVDFSTLDYEDSAYNLGVGYNYALRPNLDLVGRVSYIHGKCHSTDFNCVDSSNSVNNSSTNGYGLEAQLRWLPTDSIELNGGVLRTNGFGNFDANTFLEAGVRFIVVPNLSVGVNVLFSGSGSSNYGGGFDNLWSIGLRYSLPAPAAPKPAPVAAAIVAPPPPPPVVAPAPVPVAAAPAAPRIIDLPGVKFENDSDRLLPESTRVLDEAVATLKANPKIEVEVEGHTDSNGKPAHNKGLSQRRAERVMKYLVAHGISAGRLSAKGYGEAQPVADNKTVAGRATNRRVDLKVIKE